MNKIAPTLVIDTRAEPGVAALVLYVREFITGGKQGDFKIFVRDGAVRRVVEERRTRDIFEQYLGVGAAGVDD